MSSQTIKNMFSCCFKTNKSANVEDELKDITMFNTKPIIDDIIKLKNIEWKDTVPFVPDISRGKVIKVYDGDTITIAALLRGCEFPYRFSVRLNGIDCPEMKSKDENEKKCAEMAKQEMTNMVLNRIVELKNVKLEKYGRILADVYLDDVNISQHMLTNRLAVVYDGGTKHVPNDWMAYKNSI